MDNQKRDSYFLFLLPIAPKIAVLPIVDRYKNSLYMQKVVPLERLYTEKQLERLFESGDMNSQYIMSIFFEEYEKPMYEEYINKVLLNGQVPLLEDYEKMEGIRKRADSFVNIFYNGDPLTLFETDVEKRYLALKYSKNKNYQKRKVISCGKVIVNAV